LTRRKIDIRKSTKRRKATTAEELTVGFPSEFCTFITYTRNLAFEGNPEYDYLRGLLKKVMENHNLSFDYEYDWDKLKDKGTKPVPTSLSTSNVNNVLFTNASNQQIFNADSHRNNDKTIETEHINGLNKTNDPNQFFPQSHEEGRLSKPIKSSNEMKNKFENKQPQKQEVDEEKINPEDKKRQEER